MSSRRRLDDHLLVALDRVGLLGRDEGRADIGEVGAEHARGADRRGRCRSRPTARSGRRTIARVSATKANGEIAPAWPPAPAATRIRPSAPFSIALWANFWLITSWSTMPPQPCTAWLRSSRAPSEVMMHRHLVLLAELHVVIEPVVGLVHDLVDRERRRRLVGMRACRRRRALP